MKKTFKSYNKDSKKFHTCVLLSSFNYFSKTIKCVKGKVLFLCFRCMYNIYEQNRAMQYALSQTRDNKLYCCTTFILKP